MGAELIDYDLRIDDEFGIHMPVQDAADLMTVGQMLDYLVRRLPGTDPKEIWERQLDVLCRFQKLNAVGHVRAKFPPSR